MTRLLAYPKNSRVRAAKRNAPFTGMVPILVRSAPLHTPYEISHTDLVR